jgi:GTP pyrophosphokinase
MDIQEDRRDVPPITRGVPQTSLPEVGGHERFVRQLEAAEFSREEIAQIDLAYGFAKYGHLRDERAGGDRYFEHVREVATILLVECGIRDAEILQAALLHDTVEDTWIFGSNVVPGWDARELAHERLQQIFSNRTAGMVMAVTKPSEQQFPDEERNHEVYMGQLRVASDEAILVKMADRLHNLRSLGDTALEKQQRKVAETEEEYFPLFRALANTDGPYRSAATLLLSEMQRAIGEVREGWED